MIALIARSDVGRQERVVERNELIPTLGIEFADPLDKRRPRLKGRVLGGHIAKSIMAEPGIARKISSWRRLETHAEPDVLIAIIRRLPETKSRTAAARIAAPRSAAHHPPNAYARSLRIRHFCGRIVDKPVPAPFQDIAMHVKQSPGVWRSLCHRLCLSCRIGCIPGIRIELVVVIAEGVNGGGTRTTGVFPLRFRRQTITIAAHNRDMLGVQLVKRSGNTPV